MILHAWIWYFGISSELHLILWFQTLDNGTEYMTDSIFFNMQTYIH